jgi:sRNA-binding carbon storage regulator CsrA
MPGLSFGMLTLTRRPGESIDLFTSDGRLLARVTLVSVCGKSARIGVAADQHIQIVRDDAVQLHRRRR